MRYSAAALLPMLVLLSACSSKPKTADQQTTSGTPSGGFLLQPQHDVFMQTGDFAYNPEAEKFIDKMVNEHGFDRRQLHEVLSQAKRLDYVLRLMDQPGADDRAMPGRTGHGYAIALNSSRRITYRTALSSGTSMNRP